MLCRHLSRDQGLLLGLVLNAGLRRSDGLRRLEILLGSSREVGVLDGAVGLGWGGGGCRGRGLTATEQLLGLGGVVAHVLLGDFGGLGGVGASNLPELLGLGSHDVLRILKVVIDQLLVGGVDQGNREQQSGGEERKSPVRNDLNEPVGEEGAECDLVGVHVSGIRQGSPGQSPCDVGDILWRKRQCSRRTRHAGTR